MSNEIGKAMGVKTLEGVKVRINQDYVLKLQRCGRWPGPRIKELLRGEIEEANHLAKPAGVWVEAPVKCVSNGVVVLENGCGLHAGNLASEWTGVQALAIGVCTIGLALEERVAEFFEQRNFARAVMLDSIGSAAVEGVADQLNYAICQRATALGLKVSPRGSPGYGGWCLADQSVLLSIADAGTIGVSLSEQYMMIPRKSTSFCIAIGNIWARRNASPCRRCGRKECEYHRQALSV